MGFESVDSRCYLHLLFAVHAHDIDFPCCPNGLTTTRTDVFAGTAGLFGLWVRTAELSGTGQDQLITPFLAGTEAL